MNILIISSSNPYKTAGIAAYDLYKGLKASSINEVIFVVKSWQYRNDDNIICFESITAHFISLFKKKLKSLLRKLNFIHSKTNLDQKYSIHDYDQTITNVSTIALLKKADFKPDLIIIFFMQSFLTFKNVYELNNITKAPIALYLMDMAPMTGGCHYSWDCNGYKNQCGNCPAIFSSKLNDQSNKNFLFNYHYINKTNITAIAASEWQFRQLKDSSLFRNKQKDKILLGINPDLFLPLNKNDIRKELNFPLNKKIVFFGASSINNQRKGLKQLIQSLKILKESYPDLPSIQLVIGGFLDQDPKDYLQFDYILLGFMDINRLAKVYQSSDLFLCPSIEDSGPMMINQSIMSGVPVVAFEIGVAFDLVHQGITGYRAIFNDVGDFAKGIYSILTLQDKDYNIMSKNCRKLGEELCDPITNAKKFIQLLKQV